MDSISYLRDAATEPQSGVAPLRTIGRAMALTVVSVVLVLTVLVGLRMAGAPPLVADEIVAAS